MGKTTSAALLAKRALEAAELRSASFAKTVSQQCAPSISLFSGTGSGLRLSCLLYLLEIAAYAYSEVLRRQIQLLRQLLKVLNWLINLFIRLLAQPTHLFAFVCIEREWFVNHGQRPPRSHRQARADLSRTIQGKDLLQPRTRLRFKTFDKRALPSHPT